MSANQFDAQAQLGQFNQAALQQANVWPQVCLCSGSHGMSMDCPMHGAFTQAQRIQQASQWQLTQEDDTMERNHQDRATALECLKLAIASPCNDSIVATAEHFYSFVTGQPTASVADAVVEAVKDAVKAK